MDNTLRTTLDFPMTNEDIMNARKEEVRQFRDHIIDNARTWSNVRNMMDKYSKDLKDKSSCFLSDLWVEEKFSDDTYDDIYCFMLSKKNSDNDKEYIFTGDACQHILENFRVASRESDGWIFSANNSWDYAIYLYARNFVYRIDGYSDKENIFEVIPKI